MAPSSRTDHEATFGARGAALPMAAYVSESAVTRPRRTFTVLRLRSGTPPCAMRSRGAVSMSNAHNEPATERRTLDRVRPAGCLLDAGRGGCHAPPHSGAGWRAIDWRRHGRAARPSRLRPVPLHLPAPRPMRLAVYLSRCAARWFWSYRNSLPACRRSPLATATPLARRPPLSRSPDVTTAPFGHTSHTRVSPARQRPVATRVFKKPRTDRQTRSPLEDRRTTEQPGPSEHGAVRDLPSLATRQRTSRLLWIAKPKSGRVDLMELEIRSPSAWVSTLSRSRYVQRSRYFRPSLPTAGLSFL